MILSIDRINQKSPYKVEQDGYTAVKFSTRYGVMYSVGFAEDAMLMPSGAYQFYITNETHSSSPNDPDVRLTIQSIIEEFFSQEPAVMLYICDVLDNRQSVRNRLFQHWFDAFADKTRFSLISKSVNFDDVNYYISLLLLRCHPNYEQITNTFVQLIDSLPNKIEDLQNGE